MVDLFSIVLDIASSNKCFRRSQLASRGGMGADELIEVLMRPSLCVRHPLFCRLIQVRWHGAAGILLVASVEIRMIRRRTVVASAIKIVQYNSAGLF